MTAHTFPAEPTGKAEAIRLAKAAIETADESGDGLRFHLDSILEILWDRGWEHGCWTNF